MTAPMPAPQPAPASQQYYAFPGKPKTPLWRNPMLVGAVCLIIGFAAGAAGRGSFTTANPAATVTATVTASPSDPVAPSGEASNNGPVEGEPATSAQPAGDEFRLDQPYTLSDGSVLKIGQPVKQKHSYDGTTYYKFLISYTNNTDKDFQPLFLDVQATTGTRAAEIAIDTANDCGATITDVLPGKTLEWMKCFQAEPAKPFNLQWSILLSSDKGNVDVTLPS